MNQVTAYPLYAKLVATQSRAELKGDTVDVTAHYGLVQPEYVVVPDKLLANTAALNRYFAISMVYVSSLKPKATAKNKATKKRVR